MIPFDLEYYGPESADEAVNLYREFEAEGKKPLYYAGGSEIITLCRKQVIKPGALIDLKGIAEMNILEVNGAKLYVGANVSLSVLSGQSHYPLLADVARCVADRTIRNRLTIGGNICGRLPYREAVMPFMLADADIILSGPGGKRTEPLNSLFEKRLRLNPGEILMQLSVASSELTWPAWSRRREKHGPVDYPLFHLTALRKKDQLAIAVSGLCSFPFRSTDLEKLINNMDLNPQTRAKESLAFLPGPVRSDDLASVDYRQALWQKDLTELLERMEGIKR
jgi:CO/xanthine dehydrogenase FAD-binding subunit